MSEISISTPHHQLKGYLATPQGKGPWPGVVVLHDIFGMTDVTRGQSGRFCIHNGECRFRDDLATYLARAHSSS